MVKIQTFISNKKFNFNHIETTIVSKLITRKEVGNSDKISR